MLIKGIMSRKKEEVKNRCKVTPTEREARRKTKHKQMQQLNTGRRNKKRRLKENGVKRKHQRRNMERKRNVTM